MISWILVVAFVITGLVAITRRQTLPGTLMISSAVLIVVGALLTRAGL